MKTPRLSNFKQAQQIVLPPFLSKSVTLSILAAAAAVGTVVFNSCIVNAQTPETNVADSTAGETVRHGANEAGKAQPTSETKQIGDVHQGSNLDNKQSSRTDKTPTRTGKKPAIDKMSAAHPKETQDLPNFHKVTDYLYRGGEPTAAGMHQLQKMGIKTLIDLRAKTEAAHDEEALAKKLGMKYINMTMTSEAPTKKQVETLLATIDSAKEKNEPVLVHCAHGSDRTGCMIGIWRVSRDNWSYDDTYKEMRKYWFGAKYEKLRNAVKVRAAH